MQFFSEFQSDFKRTGKIIMPSEKLQIQEVIQWSVWEAFS